METSLAKWLCIKNTIPQNNNPLQHVCHSLKDLQEIPSMMQCNSWEDGRITSTKCTTNLCNMFFKKYRASENKKVRNITLKWSFNMCKNLFKYSRPASVNTADHFFEQCICLSKKIRRYIEWMYENQWCFSTRQFYIALSLRINLD